MYNQIQIINIYNQISDEMISKKDLLPILPKLYLILNKVKMDNVEIIKLIDVLNEFKNSNQLDKINPETIDLINVIIGKEKNNLLGSLYYSNVIKYVLMPHNMNICDKDYNLMMYLSEFEIFIELCCQTLNNKNLTTLEKYNKELKEVIIRYREDRKIYNKYVINDVILDMMLSHFATILYFKLDEFGYNYDILIDILYRSIEGYQEFIDYCCSLGIHKNFTSGTNDMSQIELEYIVSYEMLKFLYSAKYKEKKKRKCLDE